MLPNARTVWSELEDESDEEDYSLYIGKAGEEQQQQQCPSIPGEHCCPRVPQDEVASQAEWEAQRWTARA